MTEFNNEYFDAMRHELHKERDQLLFDGLGKALAFYNISLEGVDLLAEAEIDPQKVNRLWVFSTRYMSEQVQRKLVKYVKSGGKLIISPQLPIFNMKAQPCTILKDECGIHISDTTDWQFTNLFGLDSVQAVITQAFDDGNPILKRESDAKPLLIEKTVDQGQIIVMGVGMISDHDYKMKSYQQMAHYAGIKSAFKTKEWLNISIRTSKKGQFLFIHNLDDYEKEEIIYYHDKPLFDGTCLTVKPRSGLILPLNWKVHENCFIHYSTAEICCLKTSANELELTIKLNQEEEKLLLETNYHISGEHAIMTSSDKLTHVILKKGSNETVKLYFKK
jgi:beta-galactosidase